ncbi:MAG: methionyl-tRNA formyltransferase [Gemmatimonadales bacterium]
MRVVFFGTPAFAVPTLEALLAAGHDVAGVVTQPDRPQGRSRSQLVPPPVKTVACAAGLTVLQPEKPVGDLFVATLRGLAAELGVVVAYGHILRPHVLAIPERGMINVHASLLPALRGAAPIQWAIRNGDMETGVTIMQMEAGLDSGPMYLQRRTPIHDDDTSATLAERLSRIGADALLETLALLGQGAIEPTPQEHALATLAPKIGRETARIAWDAPAAAIDCHVRAFDPAPGAWAVSNGAEVKLFGSSVVDHATTDPAGTVVAATSELHIACASGTVAIREVQPAGRKRQPVADWVRGRGIAAGARFE